MPVYKNPLEQAKEITKPLYNENKANNIISYFKVWGKPSRGEIQDVINYYRMNEPMARDVFKALEIPDEDYANVKYWEDK